jgi:hypothetical protein
MCLDGLAIDEQFSGGLERTKESIALVEQLADDALRWAGGAIGGEEWMLVFPRTALRERWLHGFTSPVPARGAVFWST